MLNDETTVPPLDHVRLRCWAHGRAAATATLFTLLFSACVNVLTQNAPGAMQTAESRARFELNCPNVQASILSQKIVQGWRFEGSEYTIGVRGCGREAVYVAYCRDPTDCNALSQTGRINTLGNQAGNFGGANVGMPPGGGMMP